MSLIEHPFDDPRATFERLCAEPCALEATFQNLEQEDQRLELLKLLVSESCNRVQPAWDALDRCVYLCPFFDSLLGYINAQPDNFRNALDEDQLAQITKTRKHLSRTVKEVNRFLVRIHQRADTGWASFPADIPEDWLKDRPPNLSPTAALSKDTLGLIARVVDRNTTHRDFLVRAERHLGRSRFLTSGVVRKVVDELEAEGRRLQAPAGAGSSRISPAPGQIGTRSERPDSADLPPAGTGPSRRSPAPSAIQITSERPDSPILASRHVGSSLGPLSPGHFRTPVQGPEYPILQPPATGPSHQSPTSARLRTPSRRLDSPASPPSGAGSSHEDPSQGQTGTSSDRIDLPTSSSSRPSPFSHGVTIAPVALTSNTVLNSATTFSDAANPSGMRSLVANSNTSDIDADTSDDSDLPSAASDGTSITSARSVGSHISLPSGGPAIPASRTSIDRIVRQPSAAVSAAATSESQAHDSPQQSNRTSRQRSITPFWPRQRSSEAPTRREHIQRKRTAPVVTNERAESGHDNEQEGGAMQGRQLSKRQRTARLRHSAHPNTDRASPGPSTNHIRHSQTPPPDVLPQFLPGSIIRDIRESEEQIAISTITHLGNIKQLLAMHAELEEALRLRTGNLVVVRGTEAFWDTTEREMTQEQAEQLRDDLARSIAEQGRWFEDTFEGYLWVEEALQLVTDEDLDRIMLRCGYRRELSTTRRVSIGTILKLATVPLGLLALCYMVDRWMAYTLAHDRHMNMPSFNQNPSLTVVGLRSDFPLWDAISLAAPKFHRQCELAVLEMWQSVRTRFPDFMVEWTRRMGERQELGRVLDYISWVCGRWQSAIVSVATPTTDIPPV